MEAPLNKSSATFGFCVCCAGMMALALGINLLPVFFTTLQATMGLSNEQLGRISAVTFLGVVPAILFTGPLADRFGTRIFALLGNALIVVGLLMLASAHTYLAVLMASFVLGVGAGTVDMVLSPIVGALKPENRSSAMNTLHSFYCTGSMVAVLVGAATLKLGISWQKAALVLVTLPVLVFAGVLCMRIPTMGHESVAGGKQRFRDLIRIPYFQAALLAIALGGATEMGMAAWLPAYAEKTLGYSAFVGALAFTGFLGAMAAGRIGAGFLSNTSNIMKVMLACCIGSVIFFLLASFAPSSPLALTACILAGLAGSCLWPSMLAVTADRFPRGGATMFGALAAAGNLGCIVMPWLVGIVSDHSSMRLGIATGALCPLVMAMVLLKMKKWG